MKAPVLEHHIGARRNDVDHVMQGCFVINDLTHRQTRLARQNIGHHAAVCRRHVLRDNVNAIKLARQAGNKLAQCFQTTRGRTNTDHMRPRRCAALLHSGGRRHAVAPVKILWHAFSDRGVKRQRRCSNLIGLLRCIVFFSI